MVQDNTGSGNEVAQVGWLRSTAWGSSVYYFYEFGTSPTHLNPPVEKAAVPNPGTLTTDKFSVFEESPGYFTFNINTVSQDHVLLDWRPNEGDWLSETHSYSDQTAGDTTNNVAFNTVSYLGSVGGTWHQETPAYLYQCPCNTAPYGDGHWDLDDSDFQIWDTRYNSEG
jgi:hypothetical protein